MGCNGLFLLVFFWSARRGLVIEPGNESMLRECMTLLCDAGERAGLEHDGRGTDGAGHATAMLTLVGPAAVGTLEVTFAGGGAYGPSMGSAPFVLSQEDSVLTLGDAVAVKAEVATATATLVEADGAPLAGQIIEFLIQDKVRGEIVWTSLGTAVTNESGVATQPVPESLV